MHSTPAWRTTSSRDSQPRNASSSITLTPDGITIFFRLLQSENALCWIVRTLSGILTFSRDSQLRNA